MNCSWPLPTCWYSWRTSRRYSLFTADRQDTSWRCGIPCFILPQFMIDWIKRVLLDEKSWCSEQNRKARIVVSHLRVRLMDFSSSSRDLSQVNAFTFPNLLHGWTLYTKGGFLKRKNLFSLSSCLFSPQRTMDDLYQYASAAVNSNTPNNNQAGSEDNDIVLQAFSNFGWGQRFNNLLDTVRKQVQLEKFTLQNGPFVQL